MMEPRGFPQHFGYSDDADPHQVPGRKRSLSPTPTPKVSRSEPHLDVPHLHITRDGCSPMSRVLSGLFEVDSALNTPLNRSRNDLATSNSTTALSQLGGSGGSSFGDHLLPSSSPPLRKSNSAVDWSRSGLVESQSMSTMPATSNAGAGGAFAHLMQSDRNAITNSASTSALQTTSSQQPHYSSMWGNMFGRGFFAKPVIRSEEENYRYIMALDR